MRWIWKVIHLKDGIFRLESEVVKNKQDYYGYGEITDDREERK